MQPHQLAYFVAVADTGSFTRGAERVGVVQSAVSAAVAQLERQLGAALLERGHHTVSVTAAGEALLPRARAVLDALEAARNAVAAAHGEVSGTVRLGTLSFSGPLDVADLLHDFQSRHPRVAVHLRQTIAGSATSMADVRGGALDLALVSTHAASLPGLQIDEIHREELVFACHRDHPLAARREVSVADLGGLPFIDYPTGWGNRTVVDLAFAAAGVVRTIRTEVTDFGLAVSLVTHGLGVTILPVSVSRPGPLSPSRPRERAEDETTYIPLREPLDWTINLARPSSRRLSEAAAALVEAITATART